MSYELIVKEIQAQQLKVIYWLQGEETYFIDRVIDAAEKILPPEEQDFNQTVLYGKETDLGQVIEAAKRYPMMSEHNVVIVKEAQNIKNWDDITPIIPQLPPSTHLFIAHKHGVKRENAKLIKEVKAHGVLLSAKKLRDYEVGKYFQKMIADAGFKSATKIEQMLLENLGTDLNLLHNTLQRLKSALPEGYALTPDVIEEHVGISKEYNVFELQNALSIKDIAKVNTIAYFMGKDPKKYPFPLIMGNLYQFFSKLMIFYYNKSKKDSDLATLLKVNPYFVKEYRKASQYYTAKGVVDIISILRTYDMKSKGLGASSVDWGALLLEMLHKIMRA